MPITIKEPINTQACHYINSLDNDKLIDIIYEDGYKYEDCQRYCKQIKTFCTNIIKEAKNEEIYFHKQTYRFAKDKTDGRLFVSTGLQNIHRDLRGLLCRNTCVDYDMINAHPTILLHLAKTENISSPYLSSYINNRASFLERNSIDKKFVIKLINTDSPIKLLNNTTAEILNLANEISTIRDVLYIKNKSSITTDKRYNIKSSVVNHLLCIHENILLLKVYNKYLDGFYAFCFDGFLFDKDKIIYISDLNELTKDYGVKWSTKPLSNTIKIPDDFIKSESYEDIKIRFEKSHSICLNPMCYIKKTPYEDLLMNKSDFIDAVGPWKKITEGIKKPVFDIQKWLEDPNRKAYNKMEFEPYLNEDTTSKDIYNLFRPFSSTYINKKDRHPNVQAFMEHLTVNMCNNDSVAAKWLFNLFAWRFQFPNKLPKCGVVLKGLQGSGKDRTIDILHLIIGKENDYIHRTSEIKELYGDFNSALKHKLVVQCNELEGKTGCEYKEKLKDTITRSLNTINEKNMKPYKLKNLALVLVCSNNLTPIQIPFDDRRWVVFQTGRENIGNRDYWKTFSDLIDNPLWINSLYSEFLDTDLTNWEPDNLFLQPKTEAYITSQEDNIPVVYKYLNELNWNNMNLYNGKYNSNYSGKYIIPFRVLLNNINEWIDFEGYEQQNTNAKFISKLLREIAGIQSCVRLRLNGKQNRFVVFDKDVMVNDLTTRVFKNITIQPIEDIEMPCFIENDSDDELF